MTALPLTEAEVLAFLRAVEGGQVSLECGAEPASIASGLVRYRASNGWMLELVSDLGEWGHIERICNGDGETAWDDIEADMPDVAAYMPPSDVAWRCYGLPGYLERAAEHWSGAPRPKSAPPGEPYDLVQAVLRGDARPGLDDASTSVLLALLGDETDSYIRKAEFVSFIGDRRGATPRAHTLATAPAVLGEILRRAEVEGRIDEPVVLGIPGFCLGTTTISDRIVWLVPKNSDVEIIVRPGPGTLTAPFTRSLPSNMPVGK